MRVWRDTGYGGHGERDREEVEWVGGNDISLVGGEVSLCAFHVSNVSYPKVSFFIEKRHFEVTLILCTSVYPSTVKYEYFVGMIFVFEGLRTLSVLRS